MMFFYLVTVRLVLDTNIIVSAFRSRRGASNALFRMVAAVAQKIGAVETAKAFLQKRAAEAVEGDLKRYLENAPDTSPDPSDDPHPYLPHNGGE